MEVVGAGIGAVLAGLSRIISCTVPARIKNFRNRKSNFKALDGETTSLKQLKDRVERKLRVQEQPVRDQLQDQVDEWVNQVNELEEQVQAMKSSVSTGGDDANYDLSCSCFIFPKLFKLSNRLPRKMERAEQLKEAGESFIGQMSVPDKLIQVEHIPGATITGQKTASQNLASLLDKLKDDKVRAIGVYGMGGVGKTTLVSNLNNKLKKEPSAHRFSMVIWVTVSRDASPRKIQTRLFERLKLVVNNEESDEAVTSRLHERLKTEECFLLILDDVWADIDLQKLGIPDPEDCPRSKILITSRSVDVCRRMANGDAIIMVGVLNHQEAWELFQKHAGEVSVRQGIRAVAEDVAKECAGLPLALITVGASMKGKTDVRLWENARTTLRMSAPDLKGINIEEKVFKPLKWSYDLLPDEITRSCFLFCCLYPEDYNIDTRELARYWYCEGIMHDRINYENQGIAIIQCLTDCCLLEKVDELSIRIKVHDVVRDVGIWIASSNEHECRSLVRSGIQLTCVTEKDLSHSYYKRISLMANQINELPAGGIVQCREVSTLLLQGNRTLKIIPISFLTGFVSLRILDLSYSMIESLPSLDGLNQLRALILRGCLWLKELPALDGLSGLLVLDCADAPITQFPYVSVSRLHKLEYLDLYLDESTPLEGQRIFEEIVPHLKHLTVFRALLDICPSIGGKHLKSLERVKEFSVAVYRGHIIVNSDEYVHIRGLKWPIELIEWSLRKAPDWQFDECEEVAQMLKRLAVNDRSYFSSVRVVRISRTILGLKADDSTTAASFDLLPNLEEIGLRDVSGLKSVSDLGHILGLSFSRLRSITISRCPQFKCVFAPKENQKLEKLQVMEITACHELECLFEDMDMGLVPNLKKVELTYLVSLKDLCMNCRGSLDNLERLKVSGCRRMRKLASEARNAQEIMGEAEWWNQLEWDSEDTKLILQHRFRVVQNRRRF